MFRSVLLALLFSIVPLDAALASAADHVHVQQGWIRLLPGDLPAGGYASIRNDGDQPAVIRAVSSPRFASSMLHQSSSAGGMSRMSMLDQLVVPAHGQVLLAPGGNHIMFGGVQGALTVGDKVPVRVEFGDGSAISGDFVVRPANALGPQN